ncbi:MAG: PilZ domain-containing protein [Arenicella sp.]
MALIQQNKAKNEPTQFIEKRRSKRLTPKQRETSVIQKDWGRIAQIALHEGMIIGEIKDISRGGLACNVVYKFNITTPVDIKLTLFLPAPEPEVYCFQPINIPSWIVRSRTIRPGFYEIGIQYLEMNKNVLVGIDNIINSLTQ